MNTMGALLVVVVFILMLHVLGLRHMGLEVTAISQRALAVLRDSELDDDAKGALMRRQAKRLFVLFFFLTFAGAAALLAPVGLIYALDVVGLISFEGVMGMLVSWEFLLATTAASLLVIWALAKR